MKTNLKKFIKKLVSEYTGTGSGGGNSNDGNDIPSQRINFDSDSDERKWYANKNVYGAEGGHYRREKAKINIGLNQKKMGMFELKDFIKKIVQEIEVEEQAYPDATLTTQGQSIHRAPGIWEEEIQEQASSGDQKRITNKKIHHQKAIAKLDIELAEKNKSAIAAQMQQQTSAMGPQIDQIEQQLYQTNDSIKNSKIQLRQLKAKLESLTIEFNEIEPTPENEELRTQVYEQMVEVDAQIETTKGELDGLKTQQSQLTQQRDGILKQKSAASAAASSQMIQADRGISDMRKALNKIGTTMQENIFTQYLRERKNANLMEIIDSYQDNTRGSLQQFFQLFDDGLTNSECKMHFAQKGIEVPESYISKVKKEFEAYKNLKQKLGFLDQEAKDFKKDIDPFQDQNQEKQLTSKLFKL